MKTEVAQSSIQVYHDEVKDNLELAEADIVLKYLATVRSATRRMIQRDTDMVEISNVARAVNCLIKTKDVIYSHTDKCPITGRKVQWVKVVTSFNAGQQIPLI